MKVPWFAAPLVLLFGGLAALAGSSADDLKAMQGQWAVTIAEMDGKPTHAEIMNLKLVLTVEGENFRILSDGKLFSGGTLKLDASKNPRTIDTTTTEGPAKGTVQKGIYEIKGDKMTGAFAKPGSERPTEFKTKEGSGLSIVRYERMKK